MAKPTQYDVMLEGKKIAGAAQRLWRYLHQGSIATALPKEDFFKWDPPSKGPQAEEAMLQNTFSLLGTGLNHSDLKEVRETLKHQLQKEFIHE